MSNLSIENLNRVVQTGDIEGMMGSSTSIQRTKAGTAEPATAGPSAPGAGVAADGKTFSDILSKSMEQVNEQQVQANDAIHELVAGRNKNIHETMLTIERADTSLKLMMQVRNKILDAYREIMRMQV